MRPLPAALLLCAILLPGCSTEGGPGAHAGDPYIVYAQQTPLYANDPTQVSAPADSTLDKAQRLTMLSYEVGYSHVAVTATGRTGYVATTDIGPAAFAPQITPAPVPTPTPIPGPTPPAVAIRHRHSSHTSTPPPPVSDSDVPLPTFYESLPPPNAPPFRY